MTRCMLMSCSEGGPQALLPREMSGLGPAMYYERQSHLLTRGLCARIAAGFALNFGAVTRSKSGSNLIRVGGLG